MWLRGMGSRGCRGLGEAAAGRIDYSDFCAAGIKSCSRNSLFRIRRGAKNA